MSENIAQQGEEVEVLASIYPEEFSKLENDSSFKLLIRPNPDGDDNHVIVSLLCDMPPSYPSDSIPNMSIRVEKGLSENQADEIKVLADRVAQENVGGPSIFAVAEAIKEWLVDNNIAGQDGSMYSEMLRRMQQKEVQEKKTAEKAALRAAADSEFTSKEEVDLAERERLRKRQEGTMVTIETFNAWKIKFEEEMANKELELVRSGAKSAESFSPLAAIVVGSNSSSSTAASILASIASDGRPTGKQFFQLNMANGVSGKDGMENPDADIDENELALAADVDRTGGAEVEDDDDDSEYVPSDGDSEDFEEDDDYLDEEDA